MPESESKNHTLQMRLLIYASEKQKLQTEMTEAKRSENKGQLHHNNVKARKLKVTSWDDRCKREDQNTLKKKQTTPKWRP